MGTLVYKVTLRIGCTCIWRKANSGRCHFEKQPTNEVPIDIPRSSWNIDPVERMFGVITTGVTVATQIKVIAFGTLPAKSLEVPLHAGVALHTFMFHHFENKYQGIKIDNILVLVVILHNFGNMIMI